MKISEDMVIKFNEKMKNESSDIRLVLSVIAETGNPKCDLTLSSLKYVKSMIINPTDEFYEILESFFKQYGIELTYNNTGCTFWSKSGWRNINNM